MGKYILCGMDAHDKSLVTRISVDKEKPVTRNFPRSEGGLEKLIGELRQFKKKHGAERIQVAYEASSLGFGLYDELVEQGLDCAVLAPHKIRQSAEDKKRKTDVRDAQRILEQLKNHYLAGNELPAVWIPDPKTREDRQLVRLRLEVGQKITEQKTQLKSFLKVNGLEVDSPTQTEWTKGYRKALEQMGAEGSSLPNSLRQVVASHCRVLKALDEEERRLEEAMGELAKEARYKEAAELLMKEFVGVGLLTAMVFLTEMGDLNRFKNRQQVGAYLGLVPTSFESGVITDRKGHITRQGSPRMRKVLCQAVWCRNRYVKKDALKYERIVARNPKKKKIAVVACMRLLGIQMWRAARSVQPETLSPAPVNARA